MYLDFGLAVPKLSVHGMISSVKELLELAPLKKVIKCEVLEPINIFQLQGILTLGKNLSLGKCSILLFCQVASHENAFIRITDTMEHS